MIKRLVKLGLCITMMAVLVACTNKAEFKKESITATKLQEKLDNKDSFFLMIERENCGFCEAIEDYIEETKDENPGYTIYSLDSTDFNFKRDDEKDMTLESGTADGKILLDMAPYFLYTPTIYVIKDGKAILAGIGFDHTTGEISVWDTESTIDFEKAKSQNLWDFLKENQ